MGSFYDFIVIGGGSAGYAAARTAVSAGKSVAIVDNGPVLGGLCILRGCMPSKTLLHVTDVLQQARMSGPLGLRISNAGIDMKAVQTRKREIVEEFATYRRGQLQSERFRLIRKAVRFTGMDEVETADGERIKAKFFVIATGSVPQWPDVPGLVRGSVWTSDDVLNLDSVPESVIVLGGGVVACELAQFLCRAGSRVTLVQRSPRLLKEASPEAADVVRKALEDEGVRIVTGTRLLSVVCETGGAGFSVEYEKDGDIRLARAEHVLNALGRVPSTDGLELAAAGVVLDGDGRIHVDDHQMTSNPKIFAAGDVCGPVEIVHVAVMQGELAAKFATGQRCDPVDYSKLTRVVFTDPQVAQAGLGEADLVRRGIPFRQASYPFDDHGKSILMEAKRGFVRLFVGAHGGILGAECVGRDAGELIHPMVVALALGADCESLLKAQWYHPTLSEIWTYPLEELV